MDSKDLSTVMMKSFSIACAIFLPIILLFLLKTSGADRALFDPSCFGPPDAFGEKCRPYIGIIWLSVFSLACGATTLGMITSVASRKKGNVFLLGKDFSHVLLFSFFGIIIGLMTLSLFIGGFIQGELFPSILPQSGSSYIEISMRPIEWAKLAIWAFIFGFSERLFPSVADTLGRQVSSQYPEDKNDS